jgi:hypothetical protein
MSDSAYKIGGKPILSIAGIANVLLGDGAGFNNQGSNNIFIGKTAGFLNASGFANTFIGESAGYSNTQAITICFWELPTIQCCGIL